MEGLLEPEVDAVPVREPLEDFEEELELVPVLDPVGVREPDADPVDVREEVALTVARADAVPDRDAIELKVAVADGRAETDALADCEAVRVPVLVNVLNIAIPARLRLISNPSPSTKYVRALLLSFDRPS